MPTADLQGPPLRVVIIEDQTLFRQMTVEIVAATPRFAVAGAAASGEEGWHLCEKSRPDLVILDLHLPGVDGFVLCDRLRRELPETRIIVVTSMIDTLTIARLMEAGVAGYVEKDQPLETLRTALRRVAGGELYFTRIVNEKRRQFQSDPQAVTKILSSREQEVLALVANGSRNREIAGRLGISQRTVEAHRASLMRKLNVDHVAGLIDFARSLGLARQD